jgi:acyl-CoA synthetase (AMP-forming)/AMP-acid ligase II
MNVVGQLEKWSKKFPHKSAIVFRDQSITYRQLRDNTFKLCAKFSQLGLKKGESVAIYLANSPEYIYSYLAIFSLGLIAVPLDFMLTEDELRTCLSHCKAGVLIAQAKEGVSVENLIRALPSLKKIILPQELARILNKKSVSAPRAKISAKDYSLIVYSSGTTGRPKGILWNYRHLDSGPKTLAYFAQINHNFTMLCCLPFSHGGGLVFIQSLVAFGITLVVMERFVPLDFLKNIQKYKVNVFFLVPSMYYVLLSLKELSGFDLSSLKWITCFGAASSAATIKKFRRFCPQATYHHGWGMMETAPPNVVLPAGSDKIDSIGKAAPWFEVKIVDEQDKEVRRGEIGQLIVRGWPVMEGYYKDAKLTRQVMKNGWLHTGDLAKMDKEGFIYILGRITERIKVGGLLVYASEVEVALLKHPRIREAAVIGVPDKLRGEVPRAFMVLKNGNSVDNREIRYFCRRHLAHFKIPRYFELMPALPKTGSGKIDKEKLRSEFI